MEDELMEGERGGRRAKEGKEGDGGPR